MPTMLIRRRTRLERLASHPHTHAAVRDRIVRALDRSGAPTAR